MSQDNVHSDNGLKNASVPWYDTGNVIRWFYNFSFMFISKPKILHDYECVYVLGSGKYVGHQATDWANAAVERLLYLSYRNCFPPLMNGIKTDRNWGCMIRSGQMMLAHAFMRYFNGGNPQFGESVEMLRNKVQGLFFDLPSAPFGIHAVTSMGASHGIPCGKWFGPTPLAISLSCLYEEFKTLGGDGPVVIALPGRSVNGRQVRALLENAHHILLIFPVMMGISAVSENYAAFLIKCFEMKSFVGIIGGRNGAAFYICGNQGDSVFCLDPHYLQRAFVSPESRGTLSGRRRTFQIEEMDTSMLLGFYIASTDDFTLFEEEMEKANADLMFPLITVVPDDNGSSSVLETEVIECLYPSE